MQFIGDIDRIPFRIGAFGVFPARNVIECDGKTTPVESPIMDVLCALAEQPGELVARDALISHIWFFNPTADESLTRATSLLRKAFRADPEGQPYIETVWKRGYRLAAPVVRPEQPPASIAEMPSQFANPASDIASYSVAVPRLRVAAHSSAAQHAGSEASAPQLCKTLGVRYLVSGSLTRAGDAFHLRVALMDGLTNSQLWSQRIDEPLERFFAIEDQLVLDISTSILSEMQLSEAASVKQSTSFNLNAYELVQYAEALRERYSRETADEIIQNLKRALELDPDNATVHASMATQLTQNVVSRFSTTPAETFALARKHIDRALRLDPNSAEVLTAAGITATMMGNARLAVRQLTRAVRRDPNDPHALAVLGWQVNWLNADAEGTAMIETAERRAPHHPRNPLWAYYRGHCEAKLGNLDAAIEAYRTAVDRNPNYHLNYVSLASIYAVMKRDDEAAEAIAKAVALVPDYTAADYDILVHRMAYMFGDAPSREEVVSDLHRVWPAVSPSIAA